MESLSKIKAVILGHAVADALGVPAEFSYRENLDKNPVTDMGGFGTHNVPQGFWSDDTSMSIAALDSLGRGYLDYNEIMDNFVKWIRNAEYTPGGAVFDVGVTCINVLNEYMESGGADAVKCGHDGENSNGNGSLMRIHPFALFMYYNGIADEEHMHIIHDASSMTHAHERAKVACGIYSFVLWELLSEPSFDSVIKGLDRAKAYYKDSPELKTYSFLLDRIGREAVLREDISSSGYVVDTIEAAFFALASTKSYKECVLSAVNLGRDTDTVAAIAGGLAGALYGYGSIPEDWLSKLARLDYLVGMCERAADKWGKHPIKLKEPFDYDSIERFVKAQELNYDMALSEITEGKKTSHWMWYIFPQIKGLGQSRLSVTYSIKNLGEAREYLAHPLLGERIRELARVLLSKETSDPQEIFGGLDSLKLCSSMTLFALVSEEGSLFHRVIDKYFGGEMDDKTLMLAVMAI